jgi:hypothetical protein
MDCDCLLKSSTVNLQANLVLINNDEFWVYFEEWWIEKLPLWYEAAFPGEGTNNGLEAVNRYIKQFDTGHRRLSLHSFFKIMLNSIKQYNMDNNTCNVYFTELRFNSGDEKRAIAWLNSKASNTQELYPSQNFFPRFHRLDDCLYIDCPTPMDAATVHALFSTYEEVDLPVQ